MSVHLHVAERPMAWLRSRLHQLVRYAGVSAISTTTSLVTLALGMTVFGLGAVWANLMATAIGTVPSFELNRRWVWRSADRRSLARQVVPFTALSFTGLGLSTLTVHLAAATTTHWSNPTRTLAIELANVFAYGSLWVIQFVLLDRLLFHRGPDARPVSGGRLKADTDPSAVIGTEERAGVAVVPDEHSRRPHRADNRVHASAFDAA